MTMFSAGHYRCARWTAFDALEQACAALPDAAFASKYKIAPAVIHRVSEALEQARHEAGDGDVLAALVAARAVLPRAWPTNPPTDLFAAIDATITSEYRNLLKAYPDSTRVSELYDTDELFATVLNELIPNFEYPDHSHKTVAEINKLVARNAGIPQSGVEGCDFADLSQDDRYITTPVSSKLILALPVTSYRPEPIRVSERHLASGETWFEVEIFSPSIKRWIEEKSHDSEEGAVKDATGWYPEPELVSDGQYVGPIVELNGKVAIQDIGRGKLIAHDLSKLAVRPAMNQTLDIRYAGGQGHATNELTGLQAATPGRDGGR